MAKSITIRIPEDVEKYIIDAEKGVNASIVEALQDLIQLRSVSDREIKGKFSENEWKFFADSLNGTMITDMFRTSTSALIAHNEDAETYEGTATKWDVNLVMLNAKCSGLTGAQIEALYRRVERYWDNCNNVDLEVWSKF